MEIRSIGNGRRQEVCAELLSHHGEGRFARAVLLPIPTVINEEGYIRGSSVTPESLASMCAEDTLAVGYGLPESLRELLSSRGAKIYDLSLDEEFLLGNARLTALGTLGYILTEYPASPDGLYIGIVGYGRIGKALLNYLLFLGVKARVYTTRREVMLSLCEMGIESRLVGEASELSELDLLINTAPSVQFSESDISSLPEGYRIIELASGKNFPDWAPTVTLRAVPEKSFPESAGRLMYKAILSRCLRGAE